MRGMDDVTKDPRFSHIVKDVRFKRLPKKHVKTRVDKRFTSMFTDEKFQIKCLVDKRGKPLDVGGSEDLRRYYDLSDPEDEVEDNENAFQESNDRIDGESLKDSEQSEPVIVEKDEFNERRRKEDIKLETKRLESLLNDEKCRKQEDEAQHLVDGTEGSEYNNDLSSPQTYEKSENKDYENVKHDDFDNLRIEKKGEETTYESVQECQGKLGRSESAKKRKDEIIDIKEQKDQFKMENKKKISERKLLTAEIKKKLRSSKIDYARGESKFMSDSSSEEDVTDDEVSDYEVHDWGELDNDAERTEESTNRLAICHMDWDRIKAVDLMVLFNSFLPPNGVIKSITIYPSEFGLQRMKEEEEKGPAEFRDLQMEKEDEEGKMDREQMEKLRKYQLNRLKYYYAIMVCDSKETANVLYKECDGLEYECSAVKLDLRFVPDDTTFDQEPKDICTTLPDPSTYKPRLFQTTALTSSKVNLTWDENDPDREDLVKSLRSGNVDDKRLNEYLACSSSEEENCDEDEVLMNDNVEQANGKPEAEHSTIEKYKALLADLEMKENKKKNNNEVNLEVTWNLKLETKANEVVKEKIKENENLTPFEQYLDKRKEKRKKKKQERKSKLDQAEKISYETAFSDDDLPSDVDLNDPYFKEELDKMKLKKKKKVKNVEEQIETEEDKRKKAELDLLMVDDGSSDKHFSLKKIQENENTTKKKKSKKRKKNDFKNMDDFNIDLHDERFSALYSSHHFNIDPTDPHYRPTKATKDLINEKLRRRDMEEPMIKKPRKLVEDGEQRKAEMNVLVKNIKSNTIDKRKLH